MFSSGALPAAGLCVTVKGVPVEEYCFICVTIGGRRRWCVNRTTHHFVLFALQRGRQYTVQGGRERIHRAINVLQLVQAEQTHSERRRASIHAILGVFIQLPRHLCTKMVQRSHKGNMRQHNNNNRPRTPPAIWIPSPLNKPPMPPTLENTTTTPGDP